MIYIGIDPGKKGGFAMIVDDPQGEYVKAFPWDDAVFIKEMRRIGTRLTNTQGCVMASVEQVNAMPGQGVTSMFTFGKSYGFILGVLEGLNIPFQTVRPREWKSMFGLNSDKQRSIEVCHRLFPDVDLKRTERCRTDSDGKAEALLIALWGKRKL
jgi:crossover junction endodeoxyribonuclease RuvC